MRKKQRVIKTRFRHEWSLRRNGELHNLTYPMWMEQELDYYLFQQLKNQRRYWELEGRFQAFAQYVADLEKGLHIVERSLETLGDPKDAEVVWASIRWLKKLIADAKLRFEKGVHADD